jgi:hypothetical protein
LPPDERVGLSERRRRGHPQAGVRSVQVVVDAPSLDDTATLGEVGELHVLQALGRDVPEEPLGQVPVRVDQGDAFAAGDVQAEHGEHERALAGAGLADEVEPLAAILPCDAEDAARRAAQSVVLAYEGEVVVSHAPKAGHPAPCRKEPAPRAHGTATGRTASSLAVPA